MAWTSGAVFRDLFDSGAGRIHKPGASKAWTWSDFRRSYEEARPKIQADAASSSPFPEDPKTLARWINGERRIQARFRKPILAVFYGLQHVAERRDSALQQAWAEDDRVGRPKRPSGQGGGAAYDECRGSGALSSPDELGQALPCSDATSVDTARRFVPFRRPSLVGRGTDLDRIHRALFNGPAAIIPALSGMGGIGKTQLAVAYAYDSRAAIYRDGIFWIHAASPLLPQFADYAAQLGVEPTGPVPDTGEYRRQLALRWVAYLRRHTATLVIIDNVQVPDFLTRRVPGLDTETLSGLPGRSLVTSRHRRLEGCEAIPLDVLPAPDAAALLVEECRWTRVDLDRRRIAAICNRLGRLPLAIKLAGSLARLASSGPRDLLDLLRKRGVVDLFRAGRLPTPADYSKTIDKVLQESWEAIPAEDSLAQCFIWTLAIFPESRIVGHWLMRVLAPLGRQPLSDPVDPLTRAAATLADRNLVEMPEAGSFRLHPLIREHALGVAPHGFGRSVVAAFLSQIEKPELLVQAKSSDFAGLLAQLPVLEEQVHDDPPGVKAVRDLERLLGLEADIIVPHSSDPLAQLHRRARLIGLDHLASRLAAARSRVRKPWLRLRWTSERTDPALVRICLVPDGPIAYIVADAEGYRAVTCGQDGTARIWDLRACVPGPILGRHESRILAASITPDGTLALTSSHPADLRLWDLEEEALRSSLCGAADTVITCAVSADGSTAVAGSPNGALTVWNLRCETPSFSFHAHEDAVRCCALNADGSLAVTGSSDQTLKVWNLRTRTLVQTLEGHKDDVTACVLSADEKLVISGSNDTTVWVWELADGQHRKMIDEHDFWVHSCALSADRRTAVPASEDNSVRIWDIETGRCRSILRGHGAAARQHVAALGRCHWIGDACARRAH
ncbi:MAG: hypothetical protein ABSC06_07245 [Rhodopila sp.]